MTADEIKTLMKTSDFYDRYDKAKNWDYVGVIAGRAMQSAEFNEIQHILEDKIKSIGNALYADGTIIEGCAISYDAEKKVANLGSGRVFLDGLVYEVDAATLTIPDDIENVQAGIRKTSRCVTENEDASLFDPAKGTPQYHMSGAYRIVTKAVWGLSSDISDAPFFPVYGVSGGEMVTQLQEKVSPEYLDALARYDNHSNGHYVVEGLTVTALESEIQGSQVFSVSEGEAHINGYEAYLSHSVRLVAEEEPNLADVKSEVGTFQAATGGTYTMQLSHTPMEELKRILVTKERTVTLTHGGYTGCTDELPNTSVFEIVDVHQGALVYVQNTDFHFANDKLNWSLNGEEPAPHSTYSITYRYRDEINADSYTSEQITISGAVANSLIEVDYSYRMPRIDLIVMYKDQSVGIVRGVAHRYAPIAPATPPEAICLAQVIQTWDGLPTVKNVAIQRVPVDMLNTMQTQIQNLYSLAARNEQRFDAMITAPTSAYNVFVDPLFDDDMRDAGLEQTALIADEMLQLPVDVAILDAPLEREATLDYSHEIAINQAMHTKSMQINPYQNFDPMPVQVTLNPAIDRWSTSIKNSITTGSGNTTRYAGATTTTTTTQANLRQIQVKVHATGFGYGETVKIVFDSVEVAASNNVADENGVFDATFTIPKGIPTGTKLVELKGVHSYGSAYFVGIHTTITTTTRYVRYNVVVRNTDPLAQSFMLTEARHVSGVEFWLENKGASDIRVQIREMSNGYPTTIVLAESILNVADLTAKSWIRAEFKSPVYLNANEEYAITILADTSDHTVGIAELGDYNKETGWIRSQAYSEGVLFSSSNASTWTAHQNADLAFRLLTANFTEKSKTISLGNYDLTGITNVLTLAEVESTSSDTYVTFVLKQNSNEIAKMQAWQAIELSEALSGEYELVAELEGDSKYSPILGRYPQLVTGVLNSTGDYISRAFTCGNNKKIMVTTSEFKPHGSEIEIFIQTGEDTWTAATEISEATELGDGWVRRTRFVPCSYSVSRVKIVLHGSASARPKVQNISAVVLDA